MDDIYSSSTIILVVCGSGSYCIDCFLPEKCRRTALLPLESVLIRLTRNIFGQSPSGGQLLALVPLQGFGWCFSGKWLAVEHSALRFSPENSAWRKILGFLRYTKSSVICMKNNYFFHSLVGFIVAPLKTKEWRCHSYAAPVVIAFLYQLKGRNNSFCACWCDINGRVKSMRSLVRRYSSS